MYFSHRGSRLNVVQKKSFEKYLSFKKKKDEVSFWGIVTGPLKRLPMYLSYRGSSPDVVRNKVLKKKILK